MLESADMLDLLAAPRPAGSIVGWRGDKSVSWEKFLARTRAWRALLRAESGRRFALYIDDGIEFAAALFGAWHAGKTIYLPGDRLPGTCADLRQSVDGYLGEFESVWQPIVPMAQDLTVHEDDWNRLDPEFAGVVLYTSGSTGVAQAIGKKLGQMAREVATLENQFGALLQNAEIISTVSHQHIYGLLFRVLWPLAAGRVSHTQSYPYFEELAEVLSARPCALISSPAHLSRLPDHLRWEPARQQLRAVFSSGGPLPIAAAQLAQRLLGSLPIEVYGSSETGGIAWRQQASVQEAWLPFPRVDWRVDDEENILEVRSPNLPDDNWFPMADRVEHAGAGRFFLRGRVDRIAKVEGKRISLSAIERELMASDWVAEARVAVLEERRQRVAAFIVLTADGNSKLAEVGKRGLNRLLANCLVAHVEPVGIPRLWRYLDALPVNAQGKTTQAELAALLSPAASMVTQPRERLLERSAERAVFELTAPKDLIDVNGHFDGTPLVQVDWVIAYGRRVFDLPPQFRGMQKLKFQRIITPEMGFMLELSFERAKSVLAFKIASPAGTHASGQIFFGAADV